MRPIQRIAAVASVLSCAACASAPGPLPETGSAAAFSQLTRVVRVERPGATPLEIRFTPDAIANDASGGDASVGIRARIDF